MVKIPFFNIVRIFLIAIFIMSFFLPKTLYGSEMGGVERVRECKADGGLEFDTIISKGTAVSPSKEMDFDLSNPTCQGLILASYAGIKATIFGITCACDVNCTPRISPSPVKDVYELGKSAKKAISDVACRLAFAGIGISGTLISLSGYFAVYEVAKKQFENVRVCGYDWKLPDPDKYTNSKYDKSYSQTVTNDKGTTNSISSASSSDSKENKAYREWFYGGKEFSDNPNDGEVCVDPMTNSPQKYYFRGLNSANYFCEKYNPTYHDQKKDLYKKAYQCCLNRSQNYICLEKKAIDIGIDSADHVFCKAGSKCVFKKNTSVVFEAYRRDSSRLICAKSYSLCPYNFSVGGGTVYPKYYRDGKGEGKDFKPFDTTKLSLSTSAPASSPAPAPAPASAPTSASGACGTDSNPESVVRKPDCTKNNKFGRLENYCQYYTHCTVVANRPYVANLDSINPYYSKACINFVGDSQNGISKNVGIDGVTYDGGVAFGQQKNFSAPIVQCLKETVGNIFTNTAGHSKCRDGTFGNSRDECKNSLNQDYYATIGSFVYKKGNKVKENSLFETLQKKLKTIITLVLVISVTFLGFKMLMGSFDFENKKEIMIYLVKIGFVIYFVNGNAWKDIFFDGIYNGSSEISRILFKIKSQEQDGGVCNFGAQYSQSGEKNITSISYPQGKEYLMVWDTLDCKIMQYLNYRPGFSSSTIFLLIIAAFFTGGIGLTMSLSILIMAFCLIATVIRAMHIFISSAIAIVIYVFVSPIIIPLVLFEKTKNIFDTWLSHLMSFSLSPIVLFAYLAIFITLSEEIIFSGAKSFKDGNVDCSEYCIGINGEKKAKADCKDGDGSSDIINPLNESVACILNFNDFKTDNGFALFGIALPALGKLLEPGYAELRIILVLKTALFLFVLAKFMDQIPEITSSLIGENIDVNGVDYISAMKKFTSVVRGIQKRGARVVKGAGLSSIDKAKKASSSGGGKDGGGEGNNGDSVGPGSGGSKDGGGSEGGGNADSVG